MGTGIQWTDETWNPVTGCSRISDGCRFCYAEALSLRYGYTKKPWTHANAAENVVLHPERLEKPLHWRKPRMIFVNSMSDLFHEQVPGEFINEVWLMMRRAKQHTYQILTKRPERLLEWTERKARATGWPIDEVWAPWTWIGVSVESQREANHRIPILQQVPAPVRFLSCEPLLERVSLDAFLWEDAGPEWAGRNPSPGIDWVIVGGESGLHHRPFNLDWARTIRDECVAASVPYFFKQVGGITPKSGGRMLDGRTWDEMPA